MYCTNCGSDIEEGWKYCPECGASLRKKEVMKRFPSFTEFESLFDDVDKEFKRIDRLFKNVRAIEGMEKKSTSDIKPFKGGGVTIRISSERGKEPRVEVNTFGDYKEQEPGIKKRLGVDEVPKIEREPPKITEEPETKIERKGDRLIFRIKVPDVKNVEDVEIRRMEESIEVRAYAKDKAYFTLFSMPPSATIISKKLDEGELIIEIER